jgi:hypothetical protein
MQTKKARVLVIKWVSGATNEVDIFTKNLDWPALKKYTNIFTGGTDYDSVRIPSHAQVWRVP